MSSERPGVDLLRLVCHSAALLLALLLLCPVAAFCGEDDGAAPPPKKKKVKARKPAAAGNAVDANGQQGGGAQADGDGKDGDGKKEEETEEDFLSGGNLETDPEVERLLRRAQEFVVDGQRYREAVLLLQQVLDTSGSALTALDGRTYRPAYKMAEDALAGLPAEGLRTYRLMADGEAKGILGSLQSNRDLKTVREVVRRFFMSSLGDDASFLLGCLYLDRHDYNAARRAFLNILTRHPDPTVPVRTVWLRLALASARAGDGAGAEKAWAKLKGSAEGDPLLTALGKEIEDSSKNWASAGDGSTGWTTVLGNVRRDGRQAALGAELTGGPQAPWILGWKQEYPFGIPQQSGRTVHYHSRGASTPAVARNMLLGMWESEGLRPTAQLVIEGDRVYFKSHASVICCDAKSGKRLWETKDFRDPKEEKKKTNTRNQHFWIHRGIVGFGSSRTGGGVEKGYFFDDRIGKGLTLSHGKLFAVEDHYRSGWARVVRRVVRVKGKLQQNNKPLPKFAQGSALAAYDPKSGKRLWRVGRTVKDDDPLMAVRFLAPPTACGDRIVVPVDQKGELSLVALDPRDGRFIYRTFLCSLPNSQYPPTKPVGISVDGSDVFVAGGNGIIFCLDGLDGSVHWAARYERSRPQSQRHGFYTAVGWDENLAVPRGDRVVALPADAEALYVFDRTTGALKLKHPYEGGRHCVGVDGNSIVVAAKGRFERIDTRTGKSEWVAKTGMATGRSAWTPEGVYVPMARKILLLDPATGDVRQKLLVTTPDDDPVGNLFTCGRHILVGGLNRVYALANSAAMLAKLRVRIEKGGDVAALVERGGLHLKSRNWLAAAKDLRVALKKTKDPKKRKSIGYDLFMALRALVKEGSKDAEVFAREACERAANPKEKAESAWLLGNVLAEKGETAAALELFLSLAGNDSGGLIALKESDGECRVRPLALGYTGIGDLGMRDGAKVRKLLDERGKSAFEKASAAKDFNALEGVMRTYPGTTWAVQAALRAAEQALASGAKERGEAILRELASSRDEATAAAGWVGLADYHEKMGWKRQARSEWQRIISRFPDVVPIAGLGEGTAAAIAKRRIAKLPQDGQPYPVVAEMPKPPWKLKWSAKGDNLSILPVRSKNQSQFLEDHVIVIDGKANKFACRDLNTGKAVWVANLPKSADARTSRYIYMWNRIRPVHHHHFHRYNQSPIRQDGHVAIIKNSEVLGAYSLLTGKQLWTHKGPKPNTKHRHYHWHRGNMQAVGIGSGVVAERASSQSVRVRDAVTGVVLWERSFKRQTMSDLRVAGGCVVLILNGNRYAMVCDRFSGRILGECDLANQSGYPMPMVWTRNGFLQHIRYGQAPRLIYREIPSCKTVWSIEAAANTYQVFPLDDYRVCMSGHRHFSVTDVRNGKTLWTHEAKDGGNSWGNSSVQLSADGREIVASQQKYVHGKRDKHGRVQSKRYLILRFLDVEDGSLKSKVTLGGQSRWSGNVADSARARGDVVLFPTRIVNKHGRSYRYTNDWAMQFHRKSDGKLIKNLKLPAPAKDGKIQNMQGGEVIQGKVMFISSKAGIFAFGHDDKTKKKEKKPEKGKVGQGPKGKATGGNKEEVVAKLPKGGKAAK